MSDTKTTPTKKTEDDETKKGEGEKSVPYERFQEVNQAKKELADQVNELKTKVEGLTAELEEAKNSDKSEADKQAEDFNKLTDEVGGLKAELARRDKQEAVRSELSKLGVAKQERVLKLIDLEGLKESGGKITGATEAIESVKTDYPELFEDPSKQGSTPIGSSNSGNPDGDDEADEAGVEAFKAEFAK